MNRRYKKKLLNVSAIKEEIPGSEPGACSIGSCTHLLRGGKTIEVISRVVGLLQLTDKQGLWTITEPVGGQHSYKPPIDGICYELGPYRHLIRSIRKGQSRGASFSKYCCCKVLLVSVGGGDAPLLE
ncbi:uncharacterized protein [Gossypium hirsutum]|uniref:Uncharacterized protein n=1 Tax=Gossypium hirsutum TaxID=3635 RepID=A0ABM3AD05_GOSHI|nr:uncharacterized protein LOC107954003 [Gossypium hirsutum]